MDAAFATKVGLTFLWAVSVILSILTIGRERKPLTPGTSVVILVFAAVETFAVWRWL